MMEALTSGGRTLRDYASVITAVLIVLIIVAMVGLAWLVFDKIESEAALAFLGPIAGAASGWLWVKQASKDAAGMALAQPGNTEAGDGPQVPS